MTTRSHKHRRTAVGIRIFIRRLVSLFQQPIFIALTIVGNSAIAAGAISLYQLEFGINPNIHSYLDTVWWAVATVTTVGYGDVSPITTAGKVVGIMMMVGGTALFWSFTALFAGALLTEEILEVESEIKDLEKDFHRSQREYKLDDKQLQQLIVQMESLLKTVKKTP